MALIQPYIDYCSSSWYEGTSKALRSRLDVLQRKMVRFTLGFSNRHHVGLPEFRSLSWLTIPDRIKYFKLIHLFKIKNGSAPRYMRPNFTSVSDMHTHNTRGSTSNFHVSVSLSRAPSSFAFSCVKEWNAIPHDIKGIASLKPFKRELRKFLISSYD